MLKKCFTVKRIDYYLWAIKLGGINSAASLRYREQSTRFLYRVIEFASFSRKTRFQIPVYSLI